MARFGRSYIRLGLVRKTLLDGTQYPTGDDTGTGVESQLLAAALSSADTATATETQVIYLSSSDSGSAVETSSLVSTRTATDTGTGTETSSIVASRTATDTGSGTDTGYFTATLTGSDTGSGTEASSIAATLSSADTVTGTDDGTSNQDSEPLSTDLGTGTEASSILASLASSDTGSGTETAVIRVSSSDAATATEVASIGRSAADTGAATDTGSLTASPTSSDTGTFVDYGPAPEDQPVELGDYAVTLLMGPATIYVSDFGDLEPTDPVSAVPGGYTDLGMTIEGVKLNIKHTYEAPDLRQVSDRAMSRLKKREVTVETSLAEPNLTALLYAVNHGSIVTGSGYSSYSPPEIDRATPLTYRTVIIDGWAPGAGSNGQNKRRRIILRRCLSTDGATMSYTKDKLTTVPVKWDVHRVDNDTAPFKIIDEA